MEYVEGVTLKEYINGTPAAAEPSLEAVAASLGRKIAALHSNSIIHGDLTTSNIIMRHARSATKGSKVVAPETVGEDDRVVLIDFGLASTSTSAEERAVDLYLLERAIQSTHSRIGDAFFSAILAAYADHLLPRCAAKGTLEKLRQVQLRGRKRDMTG